MENATNAGRFLRVPSPGQAALLAVPVMCLYVLYVASGTAQDLYLASKDWLPYSIRQYFGMSKRYMLQYGHIVFLFALLVLSRYMFVSANRLAVFGPRLQWVNKYSLAIFLFHFPILFFGIAVLDYDPTNLFHQAGLLGGTVILCLIFGRVCFALKPWFDRFQAFVVGACDRRFPRAPDVVASPPLVITPSHSDFLALVKLIATLCVVLGHFSFSQFTDLTIPGFPGAAPRFAVPTFFMISGYFLMMSIDRSRHGPVAMLARRGLSLYYVVVPALVVTLILDGIGFRVDASVYEFSDYYIAEQRVRPYPEGETVGLMLSSLLYLNETWIFNLTGTLEHLGGMRAYSNDPFWFMCYLIPFSAMLITLRLVSPRYRFVAFAGTCLFIGIPILLLAPLFFSGALAYVVHKKWG